MILRIYERFVKIRGQPKEIALGFALGVFVGMTPSMGFQTPLAVFLAALVKWSKISAAMGVWITNPLSAPFIYGVNYVIGANLIGVDSTFPFYDGFSLQSAKEILSNAPAIFGALWLGGVVLGIPLAILTYFLSFFIVNRYQAGVKATLARQKEKISKAKEKVSGKVRIKSRKRRRK